MQNNLEQIFKNLEGKLDIEEPNIGHFNRFETKLQVPKKRKIWAKLSLISAAASIILFFGIWLGNNLNKPKGIELASVSTKMEETQNYFLVNIKTELEKIQKEQATDTEKVILDALKQLKKLEINYSDLTFELKENRNDKRIIHAMINNFQQRIELLQNVLEEIEIIKQEKQKTNETYA